MVRMTCTIGILLLVVVGCSSQTEPAPAAETSANVAERAAVPQPAPDPVLLAKVNEYTEQFYRGEIDLLYDRFTPGLKQELSKEQLSAIYQYVGQSFGNETQIIKEDAATKGEYGGFVRWARFDKTDELIEIRWTLRRDDHSIAEFWIQPAKKRVGSADNF